MKKNIRLWGIFITLTCLIICCILNVWSNKHLEIDENSPFFQWLFEVSGNFGIAFIGFFAFAVTFSILSLFEKKK